MPEDTEGVAALVITMLEKLQENAHKVHWSDESVSDEFLTDCIDDELAEVCELLDGCDDRGDLAIMREAADIANYAMMLHERARFRMTESQDDSK